jgi:hypothetical protein
MLIKLFLAVVYEQHHQKSAFFSRRGLPTRDTSCEGAAGGSLRAGGGTEEGKSWGK